MAKNKNQIKISDKLVKTFAKKTGRSERSAKAFLTKVIKGENKSFEPVLLGDKQKAEIAYRQRSFELEKEKQEKEKQQPETPKAQDFTFENFNKYNGGRGKVGLRATFKISTGTTTREIRLYMFPDEIKDLLAAETFDKAFSIWVNSSDGQKFLTDSTITDVERNFRFAGYW